MSENDPLLDEFLEEESLKIPVNDKRRFNEMGERVADDPVAAKTEPMKSQREIELENKLKIETERREAAEAKLVGVQAKFEEAKAGLEKETAEMRERLKKTLEGKAKQDQFNFLTTLLPVLDNLNLAVKSSETDPEIDHLRDGVIGTARSFEQAMMSVGVEPVASIGKVFNPEFHEAVDMAPVEPENDGKITAEYSKGYKFGDRLLRPARVQVGKALAQTAGE
ncbi:MAG TPA: nucleotide exchange factor GrpE [Pyrinomonadaceae bacterium]|nr:nucleotide exchange factor GrpE [Pyrinomonadaceae bacterium]